MDSLDKIKIKEFKPSFIPILCPVCRGHKTVNWGKQTCGVCSGLGYIKVPPEEGEDHGYRNNR